MASGGRTGEVAGSALRTILGFIVLGIGSGAVVAALDPLGGLLSAAIGVSGLRLTEDAITALADRAPSIVHNVAWATALGAILSLVLARLTPLRYVFLTAHQAVLMATVLIVTLDTAGVEGVVQIGLASIGLATMMLIGPAFSMPWMTKVTGGREVALGHFGTLGFIAGGITGQVLGRGSQSTEELKLPRALRVLADPIVGIGLAMLGVYLALALAGILRLGEAGAVKAVSDAAGNTAVGNGGLTYVVTRIVNEALVFGGGSAAILLGVRVVLGEIGPAFAWLADRACPGAVPALDAACTFAYAPNAVVVGFLASLVGGLAGLGSLWLANRLAPALGLVLILPGLVAHFFLGGTAGVFGNATGGRRGAATGGFVNGLLITVLAALVVPTLTGSGFRNMVFGETDVQWLAFAVGQLTGQAGLVAAGMIVLCGVLLAAASWWQIRFVDRGWLPGGGRGGAVRAGPAPPPG